MTAATCKKFLNWVIGLNDDDRAIVVHKEGVEFLEDLAVFDKDDIKTLCKSVCRFGRPS